MVDAPWLSPRENSGAFFIFGLRVTQFWILDFGFWIDPTDQSGGLYH
jgi:hypothetical protein